METTTKERQDTEVLASDILLAIFVTMKRKLGKESERFIRASSFTLQSAFYMAQLGSKFSLLNHFVFSEDPLPYSPVLNKSLVQLMAAGCIGRPDIQDPDLLVLKRQGEEYFEKELRLSEIERKQVDKIASELIMIAKNTGMIKLYP